MERDMPKGKTKKATKKATNGRKPTPQPTEPTVEELVKRQREAEQKRLERCREEVDAVLRRHHCELKADPVPAIIEAPDGGTMISWHARVGIVPAQPE